MNNSDRDIVISTRVRLARDFKGLAFPNRMNESDETALTERVEKRVNGNHDFKTYVMHDLKPVERQVLVEQHLASHELVNKANAMLLLSKDEHISILVGEEDHVRIQCILPGLSLEEADTQTRSIDAMLASEGYAFDEKLGYLTSCPTNTGTGMRASVMLHLTALSMTGQMSNLNETVGKFGYTMRGYYGEGSTAEGNMYQISNQVTLGLSEEELIGSLTEVVRSIIQKERQLRDTLINNDSGALSDRLFRSLGILKYARQLSTKEMMQRLSDVKLGLSLNLFEGLSNDDIEKLITRAQPASIESAIGSDTSSDERDKARAKAVRATLKDCHY